MLIPPRSPYETRTWWYSKKVHYITEPNRKPYHVYSHYAWYTDRISPDGSSYIQSAVYDDKPNTIYLDIDDIASMLVKTLHCPEVNTIFVTYIDGELWDTRHKINMDTVMFDASLRKKGKKGIYQELTLDYDIKEAIQGLYGQHVNVYMFDRQILKRLKKEYSTTLDKQLQSALPALSRVLHNTDIYEITRHMCPSWFYITSTATTSTTSTTVTVR